MSYLHPGVYVEEVPSAIKPIAGASTSTAAFLAQVPARINLVAPKASDTDPHATQLVPFALDAGAGVPVLVTNWTQFTRRFGDLVGKAPPQSDETKDEDAVKEAIRKDGGNTEAPPDEGQRLLAHAVYGFFNNGGSRCYVVRFETGKLDEALQALARVDDVSIVAAPGLVDADARASILAHCANNPGRFAILDGVESADDLTVLTRAEAEDPSGLMPPRSTFGAWYFPWIRVFDPATKLQKPDGDGVIAVPPSGHIAGLYARVDDQRGVHKAPANETIFGALGVAQALSNAEQNGLNPMGVNCIRVLDGNVLVWGARTIGGDLNADLKYVNVRRTLLFLRKSIDAGTRWVVFEPNDPALWQKIKRNVDAFLTNVWRTGALLGATPQEAFYVRCDATTNPPELREMGQVVTEIGVAIVRPAEFVIFRISQSQSAAQ